MSIVKRMGTRVLIATGVVIAVLLILPTFLGTSWLFLAAQIFIMATFAIALNLLVGYGGMLAFGHGAFFGIGAYTFILLVERAGVPFPVAFLVAPWAATLAALIIGSICVPRGGWSFALLTLAFGQLVWLVIVKSYTFTGGDDGIILNGLPSFLISAVPFYYFILVIALLCVAVLKVIIDSPFGKTMLVIRENRQRAEFIGINTKRVRLVSFTISGFFSGVAGVLLTIVVRGAFPDFASWGKSADAVIAVLLGGLHSFYGPVVGSAVMILLKQGIITVTEYWLIVEGVILLVLVMFIPGGILGFIQSKVKRKPGSALRHELLSEEK